MNIVDLEGDSVYGTTLSRTNRTCNRIHLYMPDIDINAIEYSE